jgi:hypothetical protein
MPERANVSSLEAMEMFRARLIVYREKAGRILDDINDEVIRTRVWLEKDCPARWNGELKRLHRDLEQRQQELFSAQMSNLQNATAVQHMAVQKARHAIREVETKLQTVRSWSRQYDHRVEPPARQAEKLRHTLSHDLGLGIAWLAELIKTIAAYTETAPSAATIPNQPQSEAPSEPAVPPTPDQPTS